MRLKITLSSIRGCINLPLHYNSTLQGMLYKSLPKYLSDFLHDIGFFYNGRRFKLYTFSKIISERFKILPDSKEIQYKNPIRIYISSAFDEITKNFGESFLKKDVVKLGKNELFLESIEVLEKPNIDKDEILIKTLSPITAYQTFKKPDGKNFYHYYPPGHKEFKRLLKENIRKKYEIITGKKLEDFDFDISPIGKPRKALIKYRDFMIEAYDGKFKIKLASEIFNKIYDAGLGPKNSQGFGMVEVI